MLTYEEKNESNNQNINNDDNININNEPKAKLHLSVIAEVNPMFMQLIKFGYDKIYSRWVIYYLHPEDIEEALNYLSEENGIIQHRFVQNRRDLSCKFCYICGDDEKHHLKELNANRNNNNNENKINNIIIENNINNNELLIKEFSKKYHNIENIKDELNLGRKKN